jgi:phage major head subunit gpT-like protein
MISGNVPKHLVVGARTGFLTALKAAKANWKRIAMPIKMGAKSIDLVDLGAAPMPKDHYTVQDFIEKYKTITPTDWSIVVWISYNAVKDDQTGTLERKVKGAGRNFDRHLNDRCFTVLNAGDSQTYGACYDGQDFIDLDHVDKGAHYQTNQDNENALTLSADNFETVWVSAQAFKDDQGEETGYVYDLIVCDPSLRRETHQICNNEWLDWTTGNRESNPWQGEMSYITTPKFDTGAWHLIASSEATKPLIVAMKEEPNLQDAWFDPQATDGGRYYFKFFARYEVHYGDWRLVNQGNT